MDTLLHKDLTAQWLIGLLLEPSCKTANIDKGLTGSEKAAVVSRGRLPLDSASAFSFLILRSLFGLALALSPSAAPSHSGLFFFFRLVALRAHHSRIVSLAGMI